MERNLRWSNENVNILDWKKCFLVTSKPTTGLFKAVRNVLNRDTTQNLQNYLRQWKCLFLVTMSFMLLTNYVLSADALLTAEAIEQNIKQRQ